MKLELFLEGSYFIIIPTCECKHNILIVFHEANQTNSRTKQTLILGSKIDSNIICNSSLSTM